MNAYVRGGLIALAIVAALVVWYQANVSELPANQSPADFKLIDQMEKDGVPDFTLARVGAEGDVKLADLKGKTVIVNFWASWCAPCLEEFPSMIKLVEQMNGDVVVIAISTDDEKADIDTFMKAFNLPKPGIDVVWDEKKAVMQAYGVDKIPESFIVGPNGKLVRKILGVENWASENAIMYFKGVQQGKLPGQE